MNRIRVLQICIANQPALLLVLMFGDIGFDKPGRFGLDFDDFLVITSCYGIAVLIGLPLSIGAKLWPLTLLQLAPVGIFLLLIFS